MTWCILGHIGIGVIFCKYKDGRKYTKENSSRSLYYNIVVIKAVVNIYLMYMYSRSPDKLNDNNLGQIACNWTVKCMRMQFVQITLVNAIYKEINNFKMGVYQLAGLQ